MNFVFLTTASSGKNNENENFMLFTTHKKITKISYFYHTKKNFLPPKRKFAFLPHIRNSIFWHYIYHPFYHVVKKKCFIGSSVKVP